MIRLISRASSHGGRRFLPVRSGREIAIRYLKRAPRRISSSRIVWIVVGTESRRSVSPIGRTTRPKRVRERDQLSRSQFVVDLMCRQKHHSVAREQQCTGRNQRIALNRGARRHPWNGHQFAGQRLVVTPQWRPLARRNPRIFRKFSQSGRSVPCERVARPHDQRERIVKKVLLHHIGVRSGITQSTHQEIR